MRTRPHTADAFEPSLFELRSYETHPGQRDALIGMFEQTFLDAYEAGRARILATFRDADRPERWVWIRAFRDAPARGEALANFYGSDAWKTGARACNATIAKSGGALLLRAVSGSAVAETTTSKGTALIVADIHVLKARSEDPFAALFESEARPALEALGAAPFATLTTDRQENTYPRQRIRKATVFVTLMRFASLRAHETFLRKRDASPAWQELVRRHAAPLETLRLQPTARSALR